MRHQQWVGGGGGRICFKGASLVGYTNLPHKLGQSFGHLGVYVIYHGGINNDGSQLVGWWSEKAEVY